MHEMVIYGVSFDLVGKQPIVLLKTADGNRFLPIWIGHPEAAAILMKLQGASTPRPMTHDLLADVLDQLDCEVVRITVTELRENTFYASITVQQNGSRSRSTRDRPTRSRSPFAPTPRSSPRARDRGVGDRVRGRRRERGRDRRRVQKFPRRRLPDQFAVGEEGRVWPNSGCVAWQRAPFQPALRRPCAFRSHGSLDLPAVPPLLEDRRHLDAPPASPRRRSCRRGRPGRTSAG